MSKYLGGVLDLGEIEISLADNEIHLTEEQKHIILDIAKKVLNSQKVDNKRIVATLKDIDGADITYYSKAEFIVCYTTGETNVQFSTNIIRGLNSQKLILVSGFITTDGYYDIDEAYIRVAEITTD